MCLFSSRVNMDVRFGQKNTRTQLPHPETGTERRKMRMKTTLHPPTVSFSLAHAASYNQPTQSIHGQYLQTRVLLSTQPSISCFHQITRCLIMTSILSQVGSTAPCSDFYLISVRVAKRDRISLRHESVFFIRGSDDFLCPSASSMWN